MFNPLLFIECPNSLLLSHQTTHGESGPLWGSSFPEGNSCPQRFHIIFIVQGRQAGGRAKKGWRRGFIRHLHLISGFTLLRPDHLPHLRYKCAGCFGVYWGPF